MAQSGFRTKAMRGKTPVVLVVSTLVLVAALALALAIPQSLQPLRNLVFDGYQQLKPRYSDDSAVVVLDIDERSIAEFGQWPWPRTILARMNGKLAEAGALSIGYDIVFSEPDRTSPAFLAGTIADSGQIDASLLSSLRQLPDHDSVFAGSLAASPAALAFFDARGERDNTPNRIAGVSWLGEDLSGILEPLQGSIESLPSLVAAAQGHGHISLGVSQTDDVVRRVPLFVSQGKNVYPSLALEALRVALQSATGERQSFLISTTFAGREGGSAETASGGLVAITQARLGNFIIPLTADGGLDIYFARDSQTVYLSAAAAMNMQANELEEAVAGKIILVGTSAAGLRDIRTTVLREAVPGVSVHAQIIDQIMQGSFLNRPDWAPGAETGLAAFLSLLMIGILPFLGAISSALFGAACAILIAGSSWYAFDRHGILIDPLFPLLMALLTYGVTTILLYAFAERERRFVRNAFQHYLAPNLLTRLEENPDALRLGGEIRDMTLMFMDVRNFTPISEKLTPEELVAFLNHLLSPLSDIIQKHEGAIDKYIGDSIMAFWNAPLDVDDHQRKACLAALEMIEEVERLNAADAFGFQAIGLPPVTIGIGINSGEGCVGNMGSSTRFDYSVVGDTVNVAARLESASKDMEWPVLVSVATAERCSDLAFLPAGRLELKGKTDAQQVLALVGGAEVARGEGFLSLKRAVSNLLSKGQAVAKSDIDNCLSIAGPHLHGFIRKLSRSA